MIFYISSFKIKKDKNFNFKVQIWTRGEVKTHISLSLNTSLKNNLYYISSKYKTNICNIVSLISLHYIGDLNNYYYYYYFKKGANKSNFLLGNGQ